jgi:hypothetical protein
MERFPLLPESLPHQSSQPVSARGVTCPARNSESSQQLRRGSLLQKEHTPNKLTICTTAGSVQLAEHVPSAEGLLLPHLPFVAHGKLLPPTRSAAGQNFPAVLARHALTKSVRVLSLPVVRLKRALHCLLLLDLWCVPPAKKKGVPRPGQSPFRRPCSA